MTTSSQHHAQVASQHKAQVTSQHKAQVEHARRADLEMALQQIKIKAQGLCAKPHVSIQQYKECMNSILQSQQQLTDQLFEAHTDILMKLTFALRQYQANFIAIASSSSDSGDKPKKKKKPEKQEFQQDGNENNPRRYYCWVHGCNNSHPSYACHKGLKEKEKYPNFRADATFDNRLGGNWQGSFGN